MQPTSDLYKELLHRPHTKEVRVSIGDSGVLITKQGEAITFGGVSILTGATGASNAYGDNLLVSMQTTSSMFSKSTPSVGCCVSSEIHLCMLRPFSVIPRHARIVPYVRLVSGDLKSEWLQKGVFFLDTREHTSDISGIEYMTLHGYDAMLKAEVLYAGSKLDWPATDISVVREIAEAMGVSVDPRTTDLMTQAFDIQYPSGYTYRETLGFISALYGGCFTMSDLGELRLVLLGDIPAETRYLVDNNRVPITFGGDRILV